MEIIWLHATAALTQGKRMFPAFFPLSLLDFLNAAEF
jgi:hypothetical protein